MVRRARPLPAPNHQIELNRDLRARWTYNRGLFHRRSRLLIWPFDLLGDFERMESYLLHVGQVFLRGCELSGAAGAFCWSQAAIPKLVDELLRVFRFQVDARRYHFSLGCGRERHVFHILPPLSVEDSDFDAVSPPCGLSSCTYFHHGFLSSGKLTHRINRGPGRGVGTAAPGRPRLFLGDGFPGGQAERRGLG